MADAVLRAIRREPDADEHNAIRELWKRHSIAEEQRDLPGLLSTLTPDAPYVTTQYPAIAAVVLDLVHRARRQSS